MKTSFYLVVVLCISVIGAIRTCADEKCTACAGGKATCTQCIDGFTVQNNACEPCSKGCKVCTASECTTCMDDWNKAADNTCFRCSKICKTCSGNKDNCDTCYPGFETSAVVGGGQTCVKKNCNVDGCDTCENGKVNSCHTCKDGFLKFLGQCFPCGFPCAVCELATPAIMTTQVVPFFSALQATGAPTPPGTLPTDIDMFTMDLNIILPQDEEWIMFGYFSYLLVDDQATILVEQGHLDASLNTDYNKAAAVQQAVNDVRQAAATADISRDTVMQEISKGIKQLTNKDFTPTQIFQALLIELNMVRVCTQCLPAYRPKAGDSNKCQRCNIISDGCTECTAIACTKCREGMQLTGGNCAPCHSSCLTCEDGNPTKCLTCEPPAFPNSNNQCVKCKPPCIACLAGQTDSCLLCGDGYSLVAGTNPAGKCYKCDDRFCQYCDETDKSMCYFCLEGRHLKNNKCEKCQPNCERCAEVGNNLLCGKCVEGYFVNANLQCEPCLPGCAECSEKGKCDECMDGAYRNDESKCQRCPFYCETCDEDAKCIDYKPGVAVVRGKIRKLVQGCLEGDPTDLEKCEKAAEGYYLDNKEIKPCKTSCRVCNDGSTCTTCEDGFAYVAPNCQKCTAKRCLVCDPSDLSVCTECPGRLKLVNGQCVNPCEKYCLKCNPNDRTECTKCMRGFAPDRNGKCNKCTSACNGGDCDPKDITKCVSCGDGFELKDDKCVPCPSFGTKKCVDGNSKECFQFFQLEKKSDGSFGCKPECVGHCTTCTRVTQCTQCDEDYKLQNGKCVPDLVSCNPRCQDCPAGSRRQNMTSTTCVRCPANCDKCGLDDSCSICADGHYKNNAGACVPCEGNCITCKDANTCLRCEAGYFRQLESESEGKYKLAKECTKCDDNCDTCIFDADHCTECHDVKRLQGTVCIGRFVVRFSLNIAANLDDFLVNGETMNLIENIATVVSKDPLDIVLNTVAAGSVEVGGEVSSESEEEASQASQTLTSNSNNLGYTVTSSSFDVYYDGAAYTVEESSSGAPIGLIVGCSVGGIVLIAIIIGIVYKVKYSKKQNTIQVEDLRNQESKEQIEM